jgi:hypothetical protein
MQKTSPLGSRQTGMTLQSRQVMYFALAIRSQVPFQDFLPRLKDHLLSHIQGKLFDGDEHQFSDEERASIVFVNNRIFRHGTVRINYTTYDMRRNQDSLNPRTHADVMVHSHEDEDPDGTIEAHLYWYARIIGVFHAQVRYVGPNSDSMDPRKMEFLWVRWFGRDLTHKAGFKAKRLHCVGFLPSDHLDAFGFLDPNEVIRGAHLVPSFHHGRTSHLLAPSIARQEGEKDEDWIYYYIALYVYSCALGF